MYSKAELARLRESFWIAFGRYMAPHLSAEGEKVSWTAYKTGVRQLFFRSSATEKGADLSIEISHPDAEIRLQQYKQFLQLRKLLESETGESWSWEEETSDEWGKPLSRISTKLEGVSILRQEDWPQIISFLKPRLLALDAFWSMARPGFEIYS